MPDLTGGVLGGAQFLAGGVQALVNGRKAKRAQAALEGLQTPTATASAEVNKLYNDASANPYDTLAYRMQQQNINRGVAQGLGALQDRHAGLAGIGGLIRGQNDALLKAGATAEQQQYQKLANATRMKVQDNNRLFDINEMLPYQKKFSLLANKAAAANQGVNSGLSNMFGGLQTGLLGSKLGGGLLGQPGQNRNTYLNSDTL
jgi:hypothetical protein